MSIAAFLLSALAVLPADRLQMADRLFNRGKYAEARVEYEALTKENGMAADALLFRLAECDRATGRNAEAQERYATLALKYPDSSYAAQSRFLCAMGAQGEERDRQLMVLDTDRVDPKTRAAALYHLGVDRKDPALLERCVKVDPNGKYAAFANLRRGSMLAASPIPDERRKGVEILLTLGFGGGPLADEAIYLAALQCYRDKKYGEAGSLFRRYKKMFQKGEHLQDALTMSVWCDFMEGRYADAASACGEGKTDDLAYVRAASAYALGDTKSALALFRKYLEDYPTGKYRADAELPIARMEFDESMGAGDLLRTVESAKRGFSLSKVAADELRLAWAYEKAGKLPEARAEYGHVAENFKGSDEAAEALFRRALLDAREEKWNAVELSLAEALASGRPFKFRAEALYWRGMAAMNIGHEAEGARDLAEAVKAGLALDQLREAKLMLADFDLRNGRTEEAKTAYAKLLAEGAAERLGAARLLAVGKLLDGDPALACAAQLEKLDSPEWRQAGYALRGAIEERRGGYTAALEAYRKAMAEPVKTEEAASAALQLGQLETRAGEFDAADATLKNAVALNGNSPRRRAQAYVALAKNAEAHGDSKTACAYATVVISLFDDETFVGEAKKILAAHPESVE